MAYPPLIKYNSEQEYRNHFENVYCSGPIITFDGIHVRFRKRDFNHAFYESLASKDDTFSQIRGERIDWIKAALQDPHSARYIGWDSKRKRYDVRRRVALANVNYVVIIAIYGQNNGSFISAYLANSFRTLRLIQQGPPYI